MAHLLRVAVLLFCVAEDDFLMRQMSPALRCVITAVRSIWHQQLRAGTLCICNSLGFRCIHAHVHAVVVELRRHFGAKISAFTVR